MTVVYALSTCTYLVSCRTWHPSISWPQTVERHLCGSIELAKWCSYTKTRSASYEARLRGSGSRVLCLTQLDYSSIYTSDEKDILLMNRAVDVFVNNDQKPAPSTQTSSIDTTTTSTMSGTSTSWKKTKRSFHSLRCLLTIGFSKKGSLRLKYVAISYNHARFQLPRKSEI